MKFMKRKAIKRKPVKRLAALRGATCCRNEALDMQMQVSALYDALLQQNHLQEQDLVSLIFSVTQDLNAENPAAALRHLGRAPNTALFAVQEAAVPGGMPGVIRVLIHAYVPEGVELCHVYQNGAQALRPDRACSPEV
ncbi:MAG: chorismate mutase [Treponema sp.]|jgi:chorismate mutase|nr:chorismate mutase [Treponema sp.]